MSMIQPYWLTGLMIGSLTACQIVRTQPSPPAKPMSIQIYQKWELQRGDRVNNQTVVSALGDLAIDVAGKATLRNLVRCGKDRQLEQQIS